MVEHANRDAFDRPEVPRTPRSPEDVERGSAHESRLTSRLIAGAVTGAVVGALAGLVVGLIVARTAGPIGACVLVGLIGLGGLGAFWGGLSGLESPDPTNEPMQTDHPLSEPPVREERPPRRDAW
jgi:hypothetical protein